MNNSKIFNSQNSFLINLNDPMLNNLNLIDVKKFDKDLDITLLDNAVLEKPIYLINNKNNNLNITINFGKNTKVVLIDHKNHQNNITCINCHENSEIDYYLLQNNDNSKVQVQQYTNSKFMTRILTTGSNNNQLQLEFNLLEKKAITDLNILQNSKQSAIYKINLLINHLIDNTSSTTTARTMARDSSIANLIGKIVVHKTAPKTCADLQTKSLILSKHATVNSCPELDIYNNDVVCTHGSSVGNLDQDSLFYMQTRGINITDAKQILLQAFIEPIIKKIKYQEIIEYLDIKCT